MKKALIVLVILALLTAAYFFFVVKKKKTSIPTTEKPPVIITPVQSATFTAALDSAVKIIDESASFGDAKKLRLRAFVDQLRVSRGQEILVTNQAVKDNTNLTIAILKTVFLRLDRETGVPDGTNYGILISGGRG